MRVPIIVRDSLTLMPLLGNLRESLDSCRRIFKLLTFHVGNRSLTNGEYTSVISSCAAMQRARRLVRKMLILRIHLFSSSEQRGTCVTRTYQSQSLNTTVISGNVARKILLLETSIFVTLRLGYAN